VRRRLPGTLPRSQEQIATLAREAEHRSKNLLATVQATVNLSQADTVAALKKAIEGRIQALANVHSLFAETRWIGAELSTVATQELAPYSLKDEARVRMEGAQVLLEPDAAQAIAVTLHELATNAAKYGGLSTPTGRIDLRWVQGGRATDPALDRNGWSRRATTDAPRLRQARRRGNDQATEGPDAF
jgi:two-component sensor histidine kinase